MPPRLARDLEGSLAGAALDPALRALVGLAVDITEHPEAVGPDRIRACRLAVGDEADYLDGVGVMAAFNFITRVADALGVDPEYPRWLRRFEFTRRIALTLMTVGIRMTIDLQPRRFEGSDPDLHLAEIGATLRAMGLSTPPGFLQSMRAVPHLLEAQAEMIRTFWEGATFDRRLLIAAGLTAFQDAGGPDGYFGPAPDAWPAATGDVSDAATIDRFVRALARRSYTIDRARIDELRSLGIRDAEILDLVASAALWSSLGRLVRLLAP